MMRACPTPLKFRFTSRREARLAALNMADRRRTANRQGRGRRRATASRVSSTIYECACGGYHLTTSRKITVPAPSRGLEDGDWGQ